MEIISHLNLLEIPTKESKIRAWRSFLSYWFKVRVRTAAASVFESVKLLEYMISNSLKHSGKFLYHLFQHSMILRFA
jgi:hypothetical protein